MKIIYPKWRNIEELIEMKSKNRILQQKRRSNSLDVGSVVDKKVIKLELSGLHSPAIGDTKLVDVILTKDLAEHTLGSKLDKVNFKTLKMTCLPDEDFNNLTVSSNNVIPLKHVPNNVTCLKRKSTTPIYEDSKISRVISKPHVTVQDKSDIPSLSIIPNQPNINVYNTTKIKKESCFPIFVPTTSKMKHDISKDLPSVTTLNSINESSSYEYESANTLKEIVPPLRADNAILIQDPPRDPVHNHMSQFHYNIPPPVLNMQNFPISKLSDNKRNTYPLFWINKVDGFPSMPKIDTDPRLLGYVQNPRKPETIFINGGDYTVLLDRIQPYVYHQNSYHAVRFSCKFLNMVIDGISMEISPNEVNFICIRQIQTTLIIGGPFHEVILNGIPHHVPMTGQSYTISINSVPIEISFKVHNPLPLKIMDPIPKYILDWAAAGYFGLSRDVHMPLKNPLLSVEQHNNKMNLHSTNEIKPQNLSSYTNIVQQNKPLYPSVIPPQVSQTLPHVQDNKAYRTTDQSNIHTPDEFIPHNNSSNLNIVQQKKPLFLSVLPPQVFQTLPLLQDNNGFRSTNKSNIHPSDEIIPHNNSSNTNIVQQKKFLYPSVMSPHVSETLPHVQDNKAYRTTNQFNIISPNVLIPQNLSINTNIVQQNKPLFPSVIPPQVFQTLPLLQDNKGFISTDQSNIHPPNVFIPHKNSSNTNIVQQNKPLFPSVMPPQVSQTLPHLQDNKAYRTTDQSNVITKQVVAHPKSLSTPIITSFQANVEKLSFDKYGPNFTCFNLKEFTELNINEQCSECGIRLKHPKLTDQHLDEHYFKNSSRIDSNRTRGFGRYKDLWVLGVNDNNDQDNGNHKDETVNAVKKCRAFDDINLNKCSVCFEMIKTEWDDDQYSYMLIDTILDKGRVYHTICHEDMSEKDGSKSELKKGTFNPSDLLNKLLNGGFSDSNIS